MAAPETFRWKPALLARADTLTVDGTRLALDDNWTLDAALVEDAAFTNQVIKGNRMVRLDLYTPELRRSIGYTGGRVGYDADPDARTHLAACAATLRALALARPGQQIALGVIRGGRWGMFLVGLGTLLGGLILAVAALASGIGSDRLLEAAIPTLFLILLGAVLTYGNWPWRKRPRINPAALADTLDEILSRSAPDA
ncbi:hypothetical protein [Maritimibacter sp. UBA3975]|uniref:hypothetical protein n=1 Tax=Maritimibacter sp. UBA3975 TaxID=1946833 RepID=UPI000C0B61E4|nr:hypothetical protein [Maritimibacter sp. UBA3975]MAM62573.1 hypothetical protein [Maritimibacter sp.]|tara:strand:- start:11744 stop:12337 length:594 start_codon:yes stop_codon:yes gene_type:complete